MAKLTSETVKTALQKQLSQAPDEISVLGKTERPNSWTYKAKFNDDDCVIKVIKPVRRDDEEYSVSEEEALERIKKRKDIKTVAYVDKGKKV